VPLASASGTTVPGSAATATTAARPTTPTYRVTGPLIAAATWVTREGERSLQVSPTDALRGSQDADVARRAWQEVLGKAPDADTPGMLDQFVCHAQFASQKAAWFLEPRRPAVGYTKTVLAGCNPGDVQDGG